MPDLAGRSLLDVLAMIRRDDLLQEREELLKQVEKPRFNIGTGPPGRVD